MSNEIANAIKSQGQIRHPAEFGLLNHILMETGTHPCVVDYSTSLVREEFLEEIRENFAGCKVLHENFEYDVREKRKNLQMCYMSIEKGYYIEFGKTYDVEVKNFLVEAGDIEDDELEGLRLKLYYPLPESSLYNKDVIDKIHSIYEKHVYIPLSKPETSKISMICRQDGDLVMRDFFLPDNYTIDALDLHYGEGFEEFHRELIQELTHTTKGLVLLHGDPGTGKTYYIRSVLKELNAAGKVVIYIPPSMVEDMSDPSMLDFIQSHVQDLAEEDMNCVLLIEDAEPLLNRHERTTGISILLNFTDGIYNDILKIQVIATFNVKTADIDEALMRNERLIAEKEFGKLEKEDANKLLQHLEVDFVTNEPMSVAEIYSKKKNKKIIRHGKKKKNKIGF